MEKGHVHVLVISFSFQFVDGEVQLHVYLNQNTIISNSVVKRYFCISV